MRGFTIRLLLMMSVISGIATASRDSVHAESVDIGSRRELFVDETLTERTEGGVTYRLHHPTAREVAITFEKPWEGNSSGYATVFQDGSIYRMYYRGHRYLIDPPPLRQAQSEVVCYAESRDGIQWTKPNLELFDWPPTANNSGPKDNNIIWRGGPETHNFAPFKDTNPACSPEERYKAVGGTTASNGLLTFRSADGIHWSPLSSGPVVTTGAFDSHNTVFWDESRQRYSMYVRYFSEADFKGLRSIGMSHSTDFRSWSEPVGITYPKESLPQQMYTNQISPYYRAPHILMGFPTRFVSRPLTEHAKRLEPVRTRALFAASIADSGAYTGAEVTDGLFMTSRDGLMFRRWDEAFLRPGREAEGRWIYGDNYQSYGLFETPSETPGCPNEISMHFNEGSWRDAEHRLRRYTIRLDGFVSLNAPLTGGAVTTKPLKFSGRYLTVNYATSAAGSLRVEIQTTDGQPVPGYSLSESDELFGDSVAQQVTWKDSADVSSLAGKEVRLRFVLHDGDIFSYQFSDQAAKTGELPRVLIIGDSISIGYTPFVEKALTGEAVVVHHPGNGSHTGRGLEMIENWLEETPWNVIHFNWGLHDLCYRHPNPTTTDNRDKVNGRLQTSLEQYERNLDQLVTRLKKTGAALIWANTTRVPEGEPGRFAGDELRYNAVAEKVMKQHGIPINDLHAASLTFGPELFKNAGDVHYTPAGYEELGRTVAESVRKALRLSSDASAQNSSNTE